MNTIDAATIVFQDVLGFDNPEFASAYVQLAYSDQAELDALWFDLNCDSMKTILANVIAERTGTLPTLVKAAIQTKPQFGNYSVMNHIAWQSLVNHAVSQKNAEITCFELAKIILMYPDCPKFSEACEYVMELGCDVPSDFRADFTVFFNETVSEYIEEEAKNDERERD